MADELTPQVETQVDTQPPPISWDNPPPETPVAEAQPADATPPTTPLETTDATPAEAQPAAEVEAAPAPARESEPEAKDDFVPEPDDPPELAALTTPNAKRWAQRQFKEAKPTRLFLDTDTPIQTFGDDLYQRSPSRYWEHVDDVFKNHQDYFVQKVSELQSKATDAPPTPSLSATAPTTAITEAELATLSDTQILERFEAARKSAREEAEKTLRAEFDKKFTDLESKFNDVNGKFTTTQDQARAKQELDLESELKTNVMKVVQDRIKEMGLEPKADDPPKIASLKKAAVQIMNTQFEPTFDADDSNRQVVKRVLDFVKRLERDNVFREEDNLKVRALAAVEKVAELPEVKTIRDEILAFVEQSKAKPRATDPAPPVAGAAAGVTVAPPSSWDDAITQAKTAESARV